MNPLAIVTLVIAVLLSSITRAGHVVDFDFEFEDRLRPVRVFVPDGAGDPAPLLFVLHGGGGSPAGIARKTRIDALAKAHGFYAVYAGGSGPFRKRLLTWNAGNCCGPAMRNNVNDVGYISALLDELMRRFKVDGKRVYATGHSNGAQMSYRLGCELSERIAAIAPVGGALANTRCEPVRKVPLLHIHGDADQCARYLGGNCGGCFGAILRAAGRPGRDQRFACTAVPETVFAWGRKNGCDPADAKVSTRDGVACHHLSGCEVQTVMCTVLGGGHRWPGDQTPGPGCARNASSPMCQAAHEHLGPPVLHFDAAKAAWDFLKHHALP